jgi:hypothetical protein
LSLLHKRANDLQQWVASKESISKVDSAKQCACGTTATSLALQCKALLLVFTSTLSVQPLPWFTKLLSHN